MIFNKKLKKKLNKKMEKYSVIDMHSSLNGYIQEFTEEELIEEYADKENSSSVAIIFESGEWQNVYEFISKNKLNLKNGDYFIYFPEFNLYMNENCEGTEFYPSLFNISFVNNEKFIIKYEDKVLGTETRKSNKLQFFYEN
jgi:hypothetical protein